MAKAVRKKGDAATIHDVAARAGTSIMTVSRVVNGSSNVSRTMRELVMKAVQELNYRPNPAARTLAGAQGASIALIYTNPSSAFLSELLVGALAGARNAGAHLMLEGWHNVTPAGERAAASELAKNVAGVILPPPLCESKIITAELIAADIPIVALASGRFQEPVSCVRIDDFRAAHDVTSYLIKFGHKRIGFIIGNPNQMSSANRLEGFKAAMAEAGLTVDPALIKQGYYTFQSGIEAADKLLTGKQLPTAIFASNDDMAAATVSMAHRHGLEVPNDLSIVGFDDITTAITVWPALTTVRQPIAAMAETAVDLLMRNVRRKTDDIKVVVDHVIAHQLIIRDSVAPPPKKKHQSTSK